MVDSESIFLLVDDLVNEGYRFHGKVFSERLNGSYRWSALPALEDKVAEWSKEQPVIWNIGIGPSASFVPTLTRLLFERIKTIYGPYDHIVRVRHTPAMLEAHSRIAKHMHWLAIEALMEIATSIHIPSPENEDSTKLEELKQHIAEENYFAYGALSDYLMLQAFGREYIFCYGTDRIVLWDPIFDRQPHWSQVCGKVREALQGKRHLLVVENMHVPVSLDVLVFTTNLRPSIYQQNRWLISTNSKDVCDESRKTRGSTSKSRMIKGAPPFGDLDLDHIEWFVMIREAEKRLQINSQNRMKSVPLYEHLSQKYYHAPPFGDLDQREWAMLIKEAIRDAAGSIHNTFQQQGRDFKFWLHVAQHCFYYGILYHPLLQGDFPSSVSSDELVRCWMAEDLLFSTTSPTDIKAATSKKQSSYYRSAYEAGKIVIQALQEYSLLPMYAVSNTPTTSCTSGTATTSSSHDAITGVSKVAESVPRLQQDELVDYEKREQLRWVSFVNDDGKHISWDWRYWMKPKSIPGEMKMTTLILRGCSKTSGFPFNKVLNKHLLVLDLSYTPINCLPSGFSQLLNLHLLSLRGCSQLETLSWIPTASQEETAPLAYLGNLQVLDMNGVPLLQITQEDGSNKSNLHFLDLSGSRVTTLPSEFFHSMSSLEELILGNCCNLEELPPSMAELSNLLVLHLEGTQITSFPEDMFQGLQRLHTLKLISNMLLISFPRSLSEAKGLKELHIYNCCRLRLQFLWELVSGLEDLYIETWKSLEDIKIKGHPNLRTFSLSGPWIRCLSLHGCSSLKTIDISDDLIALEDVDLSGTALEEVPHYLPNLPQLKRLLLFNVPCFKRFPWHRLVRFPMVFYLDHCDDNQHLKMVCEKGKNRHSQKTINAAQININDSRLFHSFNSNAANKIVQGGTFLQRFTVQVKPCIVRGMQPKKKEDEIYTKIQRQSPYPDVHYSEADIIVHMMEFQPKERHVDISANNRYPAGLRHLLTVAKSIFISDDCFVGSLTELNYAMMCLEECQLIHCHAMEVAFTMHSKGTSATKYFLGRTSEMPELFPSLQILQVSNLNKLVSLVEPSDLTYSKLITLKLLKHIHLEHCPRLEKVFPCSLSLPVLETLVILFCSSLKTIFYKRPRYEVEPSRLPNIKRIYLQELPQLQHFHDDVTFQFETPKWEKLFVRGCHSFHHLPLLKSEYQKSKVVVSGEHNWWGRLQWSIPEQSNYYLHLPPPEFLSCKKHIIRSYLR